MYIYRIIYIYIYLCVYVYIYVYTWVGPPEVEAVTSEAGESMRPADAFFFLE